MRDYDRLPPELRNWLSQAALPWRASSVQRAYARALKRTGDHQLALDELERLQTQLIAKDAKSVWGAAHPSAEQRDGV